MTSQQPHIFAKLVLCTSRSMTHYSENGEYDPDSPEGDRIHRFLVTKFRSAFGRLTLDLDLQGYEVVDEFYVDTLTDQDYELSVGHDDLKNVRALVERFHLEAEAILMDLPFVPNGPVQLEDA